MGNAHMMIAVRHLSMYGAQCDAPGGEAEDFSFLQRPR